MDSPTCLGLLQHQRISYDGRISTSTLVSGEGLDFICAYYLAVFQDDTRGTEATDVNQARTAQLRHSQVFPQLIALHARSVWLYYSL